MALGGRVEIVFPIPEWSVIVDEPDTFTLGRRIADRTDSMINVTNLVDKVLDVDVVFQKDDGTQHISRISIIQRGSHNFKVLADEDGKYTAAISFRLVAEREPIPQPSPAPHPTPGVPVDGANGLAQNWLFIVFVMAMVGVIFFVVFSKRAEEAD